MGMNDALYRTITEETEVLNEHGAVIKATAWRIRSNNGHRAIGIRFGDQQIEFSIGDDYEEHARIVRNLLDVVISNPCNLPETDKS